MRVGPNEGREGKKPSPTKEQWMLVHALRTLSVLVSLAMVASCKASKEAATDPAGATAAAAKRRVVLGQAGKWGTAGSTNAVVVEAKVQQAARKSAPAMLAVVTRPCMALCWVLGGGGGWGGWRVAL